MNVCRYMKPYLRYSQTQDNLVCTIFVRKLATYITVWLLLVVVTGQISQHFNITTLEGWGTLLFKVFLSLYYNFLFSKDEFNGSKGILNTFCLFELSFHQIDLNKRDQDFYKNIKQHKCFQLILIRKVSWVPNQHIQMISDGSCDAEDWSNSALWSQ